MFVVKHLDSKAFLKDINLFILVEKYNVVTCHKAFTIAGDFHRHELIHTCDKPYSCEVCGKAFTYASTLNRHKLTRTGD